MRFKLFKMTDKGNILFNFLLGESRKRQYIATWDNENKITGFRMFKKREDEGYFLIYGDD